MIPIEVARSITEILTCFDFSRVVKILNFMGVKIDSETRGEGVDVDETDLRDIVEALLWELIESWMNENCPEEWSISSKLYLKASIFKHRVSLEFTPVEWGCYE